jgi:large-conductance mechanosensitive channel
MSGTFTESAITVYDNSLGKIINAIDRETTHISKFIIDRGIVQLAIGMIIATQVTTLCPIIIDSLIAPILSFLLNNPENKKLQDYTVTVLGVKFKIGNLIIGFINFIVVILFVFYFWRVIVRFKPELVIKK